jgi:hypothetical protein
MLKLLKLYVFELSELYFFKGALKEASVELVSLLSDNEFILQEVKNKFAIAFKNEVDYDILIQVVMTDLQKTPNLLTLNDVLIWAYIQKKDWNGAFIQSKAVDKRLKEEQNKYAQIQREKEQADNMRKSAEINLQLEKQKSPLLHHTIYERRTPLFDLYDVNRYLRKENSRFTDQLENEKHRERLEKEKLKEELEKERLRRSLLKLKSKKSKSRSRSKSRSKTKPRSKSKSRSKSR